MVQSWVSGLISWDLRAIESLSGDRMVALPSLNSFDNLHFQRERQDYVYLLRGF